MKTPEDRFWEKVDKEVSTNFYKGSRCWEWSASKTKKGYGSFGFVDGTEYAHRVSWILSFGNIPDGIFVCHGCDNRSCVNPDHLFLGSALDNSKDMVSKGRSMTDDKNPQAKLTPKDVVSIRDILYKSELSHRKIAKMFGVSSATISFIGSGLTWKGIK